MTELQLWEAIIGFFLPIVVAWLVDARWSDRRKALTTLVICLVVGAITAYVGGELTGAGFGKAALIILFAAMTAYKRFWVKVGLVNRKSELVVLV